MAQTWPSATSYKNLSISSAIKTITYDRTKTADHITNTNAAQNLIAIVSFYNKLACFFIFIL